MTITLYVPFLQGVQKERMSTRSFLYLYVVVRRWTQITQCYIDSYIKCSVVFS